MQCTVLILCLICIYVGFQLCFFVQCSGPLSLFSFDQLPILPISMLCTLYPIISSHSDLGERKTEGWEERNCFFIIKQSLRRLKCKSFCQENVCWDKVSSWGQNILDIIFAFLLINDIRNILYFPNRLNIF